MIPVRPPKVITRHRDGWIHAYAMDSCGWQFMTVDHAQADVAFHLHLGGEVIFALPVEAFGCEPEDTFVEWCGGYLTPGLVVVTHWAVRARTRRSGSATT
jgi:hypothetical protein